MLARLTLASDALYASPTRPRYGATGGYAVERLLEREHAVRALAHRELQEYFARSHESQRKIAALIGVSQTTIWVWLTGKQHPAAQSVARLRAFFDAEAKRLAQGDGIRPIERVPFKIVKPIQRVRHSRLCPFCRKARGKIRKPGAILFQGFCPKCGATGPKREGHQEALRAWNGRE